MGDTKALYKAPKRKQEVNEYDNGYTMATVEESEPVIDILATIFNALNGSIYTGKRFIARKNGDKMVQQLVYNRVDDLKTLVTRAEIAQETGKEITQEVINGLELWEDSKRFQKKGWSGRLVGDYWEGYKHYEWEITGLLSSFNTGVNGSSFNHVGWLGGDEDQYYTPHIYNLRGGRKTSNVSFLTCLYVDIDGVTPEEAEQRLSKSDLPKPTLAVATGGGVHYYWFFNRPAQANGDEYCFIKTWRRLATHFTKELQGDPQCVDIARLLRIPGTINTRRGVKSEVLYFNTQVSYSIMALHKQYNVTQATTTTPVKQATNNKTVATKPKQAPVTDKKRNYEEEPDNTTGYNKQVKDDLLTLVQLRNGDTEGYRHTLLFYYKRFGATLAELEDMNALFVTPVSQNDVLAVSKSKGLAGKRPMRATMMTTLNITVEESSHMKQLVPADVVSSRRALRKLDDGYSKAFNAYKNYLNALYSQSSTKTTKEKAAFIGVTVRQVQSLKKAQVVKHKQVKRELVASLDELIEVAVDVIEVINLSQLKEEELQAYLAEIITINNSLSALNKVLVDGEEYHDGKVRIRAVESKIKQLQAIVA